MTSKNSYSTGSTTNENLQKPLFGLQRTQKSIKFTGAKICNSIPSTVTQNHHSEILKNVQNVSRRVDRKSQWGGCVWKCDGGAPSFRRPMGVWGRIPQLPEAGGLGVKPSEARSVGSKPPALKNFAFFVKIT